MRWEEEVCGTWRCHTTIFISLPTTTLSFLSSKYLFAGFPERRRQLGRPFVLSRNRCRRSQQQQPIKLVRRVSSTWRPIHPCKCPSCTVITIKKAAGSVLAPVELSRWKCCETWKIAVNKSSRSTFFIELRPDCLAWNVPGTVRFALAHWRPFKG